MGNPKGQPVDTTHSNGLTIREYWTFLFQRNEELFAAHRYSEILLDGQISETMLQAFPDRYEAKIMHQVVRVRAVYNRGVWFGSKQPRSQSYRYRRITELGTVVRVTARGRLLQGNKE